MVKEQAKKVALIATGGTIEMETIGGQSRFAHTDYMQALLASVASASRCQVELHRLCRVDSSQIGIVHWQAMISYIAQHRGDYDGFVITHGTDTIAYTAAALALALSPIINFPVILTGSMHTPDQKDSDALANLTQALRLACGDLAEVAIAMHGMVWRGIRAEKKLAAKSATFITPGLACLADQHLVLRSHAHRRAEAAPQGRVINAFSARWFLYHALPALPPPPTVDLDTILLVAAGGNLAPAYLDCAVQHCRLGKTVILGATRATSTIYPPAAQAIEAGVISAINYTLSALIVKIAWLLARSAQRRHDAGQRKEFMKKELARSYGGEI